MSSSWHLKNAVAYLWLDLVRAKWCYHGWTSSSPLFIQLFLNSGNDFLPFNAITMANVTLLAGFNNKTSWTAICKICLHFCNGICLLSEGVLLPVWPTLPCHDCEEKMVRMLVTRMIKMMSDIIVFHTHHIRKSTYSPVHAVCFYTKLLLC